MARVEPLVELLHLGRAQALASLAARADGVPDFAGVIADARVAMPVPRLQLGRRQALEERLARRVAERTVATGSVVMR